jgi:hypothetical protein
MKRFALQFFAALSLLCFFACSHRANQDAQTAATAKAPRHIETFTGKILKTDDGYRFKPLSDQENLQRITRAKRGNNYETEEINMRKYFGKTLVIRGDSDDGWILEAVVLGQWLRPGEKRGSTLTGPEPKPRD